MSKCRRLLIVIIVIGNLVQGEFARAEVITQDIHPGEIHLAFNWKWREEFTELLKLQQAVYGKETWASWSGGSTRIEYLYQGNAVELQRIIDQLETIGYPRILVRFTEHEGFDDGPFDRPRKMPLAYDWSLVFTEQDQFRKARDGIDNEPAVVLTVHLGQRLDRRKLHVSKRLLGNADLAGEYRIQPDKPANALHAIVRASRKN